MHREKSAPLQALLKRRFMESGWKMTENDDERSNAIDSAVLNIYSHFNHHIYLDFVLFCAFLIKPSTFNCWCRPKKPFVMVNWQPVTEPKIGRCMVVHASRKHGAFEDSAQRSQPPSPVSPPPLELAMWGASSRVRMNMAEWRVRSEMYGYF